MKCLTDGKFKKDYSSMYINLKIGQIFIIFDIFKAGLNF